MNKLTEKEWTPNAILLDAIRNMYPIYTYMNILPPLKTDLSEATSELVKAFLWLFMEDEPKKKLAIELLILIIEKACRQKGLGYSDAYRSQLYEWIIEVENEYKYSLPCPIFEVPPHEHH